MKKEPKYNKSITLVDEDGQSKKLEEKRKLHNKKKPLFDKNVNDPFERGWDQYCYK